MTDYPTITRAQLVEAAIKTIEAVKEKYGDPGFDDRYKFLIEEVDERAHCYLAVAETADLITAEWEQRTQYGDRCGCLVGTLCINRGTNWNNCDDTDTAIGCTFPSALREATGYQEVFQVFRVID